MASLNRYDALHQIGSGVVALAAQEARRLVTMAVASWPRAPVDESVVEFGAFGGMKAFALLRRYG